MGSQARVGAPERTVQSIARAFGLLELIADRGNAVSLTQLSADSGLPVPTAHRLVRTLVSLGYVRQLPSREYTLGARLIRLGDKAGRLGAWAVPHLERLVGAVGESVNLAVLDGAEVVYAAQAPGRHDMRVYTEVGRRAPLHCSAVGKAMLADLGEDRARELLGRTVFGARTPNTITALPGLLGELARVRDLGYAVDDEEQEIGMRCFAVSLSTRGEPAAISVSGPSSRVTPELIDQAVPLLRETAAVLARELAPGS